jgi:hypothetical protein
MGRRSGGRGHHVGISAYRRAALAPLSALRDTTGALSRGSPLNARQGPGGRLVRLARSTPRRSVVTSAGRLAPRRCDPRSSRAEWGRHAQTGRRSHRRWKSHVRGKRSLSAPTRTARRTTERRRPRSRSSSASESARTGRRGGILAWYSTSSAIQFPTPAANDWSSRSALTALVRARASARNRRGEGNPWSASNPRPLIGGSDRGQARPNAALTSGR